MVLAVALGKLAFRFTRLHVIGIFTGALDVTNTEKRQYI